MDKTPKKMLLNGKPLSTLSFHPTRETIQTFLDKLPDNEVLDAPELHRQAKVGFCSIREFGKSEIGKKYVATLGGKRRALYGNPRAVKAVAKLIEENAL